MKNEILAKLNAKFATADFTKLANAGKWVEAQNAAALRFNASCGGVLGDVDTCDIAEPADILDAPNGPWKNPAAVALGRRGGRANTPAQAAARRENGKKGGRPIMKTYHIYTDSRSCETNATTVAHAIRQCGYCPTTVNTAPDFEAWLTACGGYGGIQENGVQIANVRA